MLSKVITEQSAISWRLQKKVQTIGKSSTYYSVLKPHREITLTVLIPTVRIENKDWFVSTVIFWSLVIWTLKIHRGTSESEFQIKVDVTILKPLSGCHKSFQVPEVVYMVKWLWWTWTALCFHSSGFWAFGWK